MSFPEFLSSITFLKTRDLEETTRFYTQIMGFDFVLDQKNCRIFRVSKNSYLGFCLTDGSTGCDEIIFTLEIEDVDAACEYFERYGMDIDVKPQLNEHYQIYQMFIRDPNGYRIELQRFLDPSWSSSKLNWS